MANFKQTLSPRLQLLYEQLKPGGDVWDLCCDHGYVGQRAHFSGLFTQVHFVDAAAHLVTRLQQKFAAFPRMSFHPIPAQEIAQPVSGSVVAAGVGAELISKIMIELTARGRLQAERLILGPHKDEKDLEHLLSQDLVFSANYKLHKRLSVEEKGRIREVFVFDRESASTLL